MVIVPKAERVDGKPTIANIRKAYLLFVIVRDEEKNTAQVHLDQAILEWEINTCIRFVHRQNEEDYVVFYFSSGKRCVT